MIALAITEIHPALSQADETNEYGNNAEWIEVQNIGTESITYKGLYLRIKTGYGGGGFGREFRPKNPSLRFEPRQCVRLVAGHMSRPFPRGEEKTKLWFLGLQENEYILSETADLVAIYSSKQDSVDGRVPLVQMQYYTATEQDKDEIPF